MGVKIIRDCLFINVCVGVRKGRRSEGEREQGRGNGRWEEEGRSKE